MCWHDRQEFFQHLGHLSCFVMRRNTVCGQKNSRWSVSSFLRSETVRVESADGSIYSSGRTLCSQLNTHDMLILNACLISKSCWSDACHCVCVQTSRSRPAPSSTRWSWSATVARWASPSPALRSPLTPSSSQAWPRGVSLRGESRTGQTGRLPKHPCDRETPAHTHSLSLHSKAWIWNDFWLCIS